MYDAKPVRSSFASKALFLKAEACWRMRCRMETKQVEETTMDSAKVIRLMEQLAIAERDKEVALLRGDNAIAAYTREQRKLRFAVESLRIVAANNFSAARMHEIAVNALQELGQP